MLNGIGGSVRTFPHWTIFYRHSPCRSCIRYSLSSLLHLMVLWSSVGLIGRQTRSLVIRSHTYLRLGGNNLGLLRDILHTLMRRSQLLWRDLVILRRNCFALSCIRKHSTVGLGIVGKIRLHFLCLGNSLLLLLKLNLRWLGLHLLLLLLLNWMFLLQLQLLLLFF